MLIDTEQNLVEINPIENNHIKIIGKSGSGKTYWSCRQIEKICTDTPVLIIDFSGSYTKDELTKNDFRHDVALKFFNPKEKTIFIPANELEICDNVTDSLIISLKIKSMMQKKILKETCERVLGKETYFSFQGLYNQLEILNTQTEDTDYKKNTDFLMNRLYHMRTVNSLKITPSSGHTSFASGIYILQLSDFTERIRKTLAQFFLELIWREIKHGKKDNLQIVLDEIQLLELQNTALEEMLREGRKYGIGLTMLTQFCPSKEELDILEQAATSLYFSPNERSLSSIAKIIDIRTWKDWFLILQNLKRGECILTGNYTINRQNVVEPRPLICKVLPKSL